MGQDQELAILFADVVGSTRLFEVLGDVAARDKVAVCIEIMRRATEQHGGAVVKTMGDEIMATFASCDAAIDAAVELGLLQVTPRLGGFTATRKVKAELFGDRYAAAWA